MSAPNQILDASNNPIVLTNFRGGTGALDGLGGVPLGTVGESTTGEVAAKVLVVGGVSSPVGTYIDFHVGNNASLSGGIPVTAKRWAVNYIGTGTGNTFGTNTSVTGGQGFSDNGIPSVAIAIACDGSTVADGFYSTT